ncbi:MAG: DNA-binding NtrC family response regulator [Cyclobacteriaceae bacterium]|jgi:two-component system nitrogen regulation response regulator NtrX
MNKILIVDDQKGIPEAVRDTILDFDEFADYQFDLAQDGQMAWELIQKNEYDVILSDIRMPKMDGIELLKAVQREGIATPVILMTATTKNDINEAISKLKIGAWNYLEKPFMDLNLIRIALNNAIIHARQQTEIKKLKKKLKKNFTIIGVSAGIKDVQEVISKVATTDARVLITGANGTGKELVARGLHEQSERAGLPMVEVNCAAIPSELIESELFGHEKGAFTSANKQRIGKFEQAEGGTLFLDEIGDMSLSAQAKVLRALQENYITRVGGDKSIPTNVRVLAATNKDLKAEIAAGNFREDLYHRLSVIRIHVPALKDRKGDIKLLVEHFLQQLADEYGNAKKVIETDAVKLLESYDWSGNIRELRNVTERLVILSGDKITKGEVERYAVY